MRNFNTSFVKNAICRFANEASQVLRAFSDPATCLLRLIQSVVRTLLDYLVPTSYRLPAFQHVSGTAADKAMLTAVIDKISSIMFGGNLERQLGNRSRDCRKSQTAS